MSDATRLLVRSDGGSWKQPEVATYSSERGLQELLLGAPDLLPEVGPAVAVDELQVPGVGSVDIAVIEPTGTVTLVECKLAANPESRRAVVGQVLAYAAGTWRSGYEALDDRFRQRLGESLVVAVEAVADHGPDWDGEAFRQTVSANLAQGAFRLFVAVDRITDELKAIIEYLNLHTTDDLEVLAFELGYVADGATEILLPRTYGQETARARGRSSAAKPRWSVDDVFASLQELCTAEEVEAVRRLYDECIEQGGRLHPGRGEYPTLSARIRLDGEPRSLWAVYADPSGPGAPRISLSFASYANTLDEEALESILTKLESVPELAAHLSQVRDAGYNLYPTIPLSALSAESAVDAIIEALAPHVHGF